MTNHQNRKRLAARRRELTRKLNDVKLKLAHEIEICAWWPEWENIYFGSTLQNAYRALGLLRQEESIWPDIG